MTVKRVLSIVAASVIATLSVLTSVAPAQADNAVPFSDPDAVGLVGFCDKNNNVVTSGNIKDVPFVWKAVSTQPAPKPYRIKGRTATLMSFSPLKGLNPGDWTPYTMLQSTFYANAALPAAVADYNQPPLIYHTTGVPVTWDGLVQVRLIYGAANEPPLLRPYPAAVIRVSGDTWTLVQGDRNPPCAKAGGENFNSVASDQKSLRTAPPTTAANSTAAPRSSSPTASPSDSSASGAATGSADAAGAGSSSVPESSPEASGQIVTPGSSAMIIGLLLITAIALAGGAVGFALARRHR